MNDFCVCVWLKPLMGNPFLKTGADTLPAANTFPYIGIYWIDVCFIVQSFSFTPHSATR